MLGIVLYAGLRRSEVLRLQVMDVDLVAGTLHINRGKGPGGGTDRTAYVPPALGLLIEAYLIARRKRRCIVPELFVCERSRRAISLSTFRRTVAAVRAAADVPFSLHSLRHSYVTMLLRSGVPIHVAQDLAGHRKITTTAQYLEVWDEDRKNAVGAIRY
jgi:integrase